MLTNTVQKNYIDQGSEINISSSLVYATGHVSLHDRPRHFMQRKAINLCVQHAYQSEKSCLEAQESHVNSLKPRVESNFRSLHSYLDQNETVKKQILLISYPFRIH